MKQHFLALAIAALTVAPSFGASCINSTLNSLTTCEIATGTGSFQLSNWSLFNTALIGYGTGTLTSDQIFVSFATSALSFSVTFSDAAGGLDAFRATASNTIDQQAQWSTGFLITPLSGNTDIVSIAHQVNGLITGSNAFGSVQVQKLVGTPGGGIQSLNILRAANAPNTIVDNPATNPVVQANGLGSSLLAITDNVTLGSEQGGTVGMSSFTNTFTMARQTTPEVPEPTTTALIGMGVLALAAMRRRKN